MLEAILFTMIGVVIGISAGIVHTKHVSEWEFVRREELPKVLHQRGIKMEDNTQCAICHKKLNMSNVGKIIPVGNTVKFVCNDDRCLILQNSIHLNESR